MVHVFALTQLLLGNSEEANLWTNSPGAGREQKRGTLKGPEGPDWETLEYAFVKRKRAG